MQLYVQANELIEQWTDHGTNTLVNWEQYYQGDELGLQNSSTDTSRISRSRVRDASRLRRIARQSTSSRCVRKGAHKSEPERTTLWSTGSGPQGPRSRPIY